MTPEQILADLRDIHLPETAADAAATDLVLWPLILVFLAALIVGAVIWRRRSIWRRDFFDDLGRIEDTADEGSGHQGWAKLARLLKRLAIQQQGRDDIAALNGEPWLRQLDDLTGSDLFTSGPGRGLITFPYLGADLDDEASRRMSDDLKATIDTLRRRLPRHGRVASRGKAPWHGVTG